MSHTGRAIVAGLAGAGAYLVAQQLDRKVLNPRSNDLILLGGPFADSQPARGLIAMALHGFGGISLALLFQRFAAARLPGPYWLRGILLLQIENLSLWPLCYLIEPIHPAVRNGELTSLTSPAYFVQQLWRHLALGIVMGHLLRPSPDSA